MTSKMWGFFTTDLNQCSPDVGSKALSKIPNLVGLLGHPSENSGKKLGGYKFQISVNAQKMASFQLTSLAILSSGALSNHSTSRPHELWMQNKGT